MTEGRTKSPGLRDRLRNGQEFLRNLIQEQKTFQNEQSAAWSLVDALAKEFTRHPVQLPTKIFEAGSTFTLDQLLSSSYQNMRYGFLRIYGDFSTTEIPEAPCIWVAIVQAEKHRFTFTVSSNPGERLSASGPLSSEQEKSERIQAEQLDVPYHVEDGLQVLIGMELPTNEIQVMQAGIPQNDKVSKGRTASSLLPQST